MTFDMNDLEPQQSGDLIPDGTFAKLVMTLSRYAGNWGSVVLRQTGVTSTGLQ